MRCRSRARLDHTAVFGQGGEAPARLQGQQPIACRGQCQCGEWLPNLKSSKRAAHLARPVSLCMAMEDDKRGCKKKKRRDAAEIRQTATPFLDERYHRTRSGRRGSSKIEATNSTPRWTPRRE